MKKLIIFSLFIAIIGCNGDSEIEPIAIDPTLATLVFPNQNSECLNGVILDDEKSIITFKWLSGEHTDSYDLKLKNLITGSEISYRVATSNEKSITVERGVPYSWFVISLSNSSSVRVQSETWNFYSAGQGGLSYAPFPAEIISPLNGTSINASNNITLDWNGSDVDGDIESYDLYFGENNSPEVYETNIQNDLLNNITVVSGKTYYWKVDTIDSQGNRSVSDVSMFIVN